MTTQIGPFQLFQHETTFTVTLQAGEYRREIFAEREADGFLGNGYDWESLAVVFLEERMPELVASIEFDPEAGMFAAYSETPKVIETFTEAFHRMCEDPAQMRDLLSRAEPG